MLLSAFFTAVAIATSAGFSESSRGVREAEVRATDGGFVVVLDAGIAAPLQPPALVADSVAEHPPEAAEASGRVQLELLVSMTGDVEAVHLVDGVHPALDAAAIAAARRLRFTPALEDGAPVAVRVRFSYVFSAQAKLQSLPARLSGRIEQDGRRTAVAGAFLHAPNGGVVSADAEGRFELLLPPGEHWLRVTAPGHKPRAFKERLSSGERLDVVYSLQPLTLNPYETTVRDERPRSELARVSLRDAELREVPGTQGDPFRVVMLMPGVSAIASGVSYPVVRGSQPAATGYFIDGVRVPVLYHLLLGPAVVHPDLLEGVDFHPGITPVRYGRLLGGAIEGHLSRPHDDRLHASVYADLLNAGVFLEAPVAATGTNVTLSGRYSYTPWLISAGANLFGGVKGGESSRRAVADFWDYQGRVEQKAGAGRLRLLVLGSSDVAGADEEAPDGVDGFLVSRFHRADARYRHPAGAGEVELGATIGMDAVGVEGYRAGVPVGTYRLEAQLAAARAGWTSELTPRVKVSAGVELEHRRARTDIGAGAVTAAGTEGQGAAFQVPRTLATTTGVWAEAQWGATDRLMLVPGVRVDNHHLVPGVDHLAVDPRLVVRYAAGEALTLKAGSALLHQPPTVMLSLPVLDIAGLRHGLQEAWSSDVGAEWTSTRQLQLSVDAYATVLTRAVEFDLAGVLADRRRRGISLSDPGRRGYSYGLEVMARHPLGQRWFGWVSYAYQQSRRYERFSRYDDDERVVATASGWLPFAFEQQHVLNAALSYRFANNLTLGAVVHFNTGRPESGDITSRTMRRATNPVAGEEKWVTQDRDRVERLPSFARLDVRLSYARSFRYVTAEAYLDVLNVTLSREVLGYTYGIGPETVPPRPDTPWGLRREPTSIPLILPMLGAKVRY